MTTPQQAPPGAVLALDMGGTHLRHALARRLEDLALPLTVVKQGTLAADPLGQLTWLIRELDAAHGPLRRVVIGLPGVVHRGRVYDAPNLSALQDAGALSQLEQALPGPLTVMNDCNLAALGEQGDDLAFVAVGTGLGCGLVRRGQVMEGEHGQAGELGLLPLPGGGVLEDLLSGPGTQRRYAAYGGLGDWLSGRSEAQARTHADVQAALEYLLQVLTLTVDPRQIVFGGGLGLRLGELIEAAWQQVRRRIPHVPRPSLSQHGDNAALLGGLRLALTPPSEAHLPDTQRTP